MQRNPTSWRPASAVLIALVASVAIAACGGSNSSGHGQPSAKSAKLKFAACVRAHGVPDYPDSGNIKYTKAGTLSVDGKPLGESSAVFDKALGECQKYELADQPKYSDAQLAKIQAGALKMSRCMRASGVPDYPDLKVARLPGGHGFGVAVPSGGKALRAEERSPAFKAANIKCSRLLNSAVPGHKG